VAKQSAGAISMSKHVTIELPDELYEQAQRWAMLTSQDVNKTLTEAITLVLSPLPDQDIETPVSVLSDEEVLALSQAQIDKHQGRRFSELLNKQGEGQLTLTEESELWALMQIYERLLVRQSEALAEAVRRGLRPPLET
jgi:hypothetical protein